MNSSIFLENLFACNVQSVSFNTLAKHQVFEHVHFIFSKSTMFILKWIWQKIKSKRLSCQPCTIIPKRQLTHGTMTRFVFTAVALLGYETSVQETNMSTLCWTSSSHGMAMPWIEGVVMLHCPVLCLYFGYII